MVFLGKSRLTLTGFLGGGGGGVWWFGPAAFGLREYGGNLVVSEKGREEGGNRDI